MTSTHIPIGTWVRSVTVGKAPAFVGEIIDRIDGEYIVRDAERRRWLRLECELEPMTRCALSHQQRGPAT